MTLAAGVSLSDDALAAYIDRVAEASARWVSDELERCASLRAPLAADEERVLAAQAAHRELATITRERIDLGTAPLNDDVEAHIVGAVLDLHYGLGGLQPYVDDPDVENINVNGCDCVWVTWSRGGRRERVPRSHLLTRRSRRSSNGPRRRLGLGERRWDTTEPILNLQLADGSRLHGPSAATRSVACHRGRS